MLHIFCTTAKQPVVQTDTSNYGGADMTNMTQLMNSMENTLKLQNRASAERRAQKAEQEKKSFQEKLMQAAASKTELDGLSMKVKGSQDALQRDQLIGMMMGL